MNKAVYSFKNTKKERDENVKRNYNLVDVVEYCNGRKV